MIPILPRMGGAMPLANEPKLCSKSAPINGGWVTLNPFSDPLISGHSNQHRRMEKLHGMFFLQDGIGQNNITHYPQVVQLRSDEISDLDYP
jgi:hypothetical protein